MCERSGEFLMEPILIFLGDHTTEDKGLCLFQLQQYRRHVALQMCKLQSQNYVIHGLHVLVAKARVVATPQLASGRGGC